MLFLCVMSSLKQRLYKTVLKLSFMKGNKAATTVTTVPWPYPIKSGYRRVLNRLFKQGVSSWHISASDISRNMKYRVSTEENIQNIQDNNDPVNQIACCAPTQHDFSPVWGVCPAFELSSLIPHTLSVACGYSEGFQSGPENPLQYNCSVMIWNRYKALEKKGCEGNSFLISWLGRRDSTEWGLRSQVSEIVSDLSPSSATAGYTTPGRPLALFRPASLSANWIYGWNNLKGLTERENPYVKHFARYLA